MTVNKKDRKIVAWMCSFDVNYIKTKNLPFIENYTQNTVAPWINLFLDNLKEQDEFEIHIFSTYSKLKHDVHICEEGVYYHFYTQKMPFLKYSYPHFLSIISEDVFLKNKVFRTLDKIRPDIIHIHGSEIALAKICTKRREPRIFTPITFMKFAYDFVRQNGGSNKIVRYYRRKFQTEITITKKTKYFGVRADFMSPIIKGINPNALLFWQNYPIARPIVCEADFADKDADVIFVARLNKNKGIEDLIHAISIISKSGVNLKVKVVGDTGQASYFNYIKALVKELNLTDNFLFQGRKETQEEIFIEVAKSKIFVLPTHFDMIPGTIIESMFIGTPVISYDTGGIPELNRDEQRVVLVTKGDIQKLSEEIMCLLNDSQKQHLLKTNAKRFVEENYNNSKTLVGLLTMYRKVLEINIKITQ